MVLADVHPIPSETSVVEETVAARQAVHNFYEKYHSVIATGGVLFLSMLINRILIRRELKHLHFNVEVFPFDQFDEYNPDVFNENTDRE